MAFRGPGLVCMGWCFRDIGLGLAHPGTQEVREVNEGWEDLEGTEMKGAVRPESSFGRAGIGAP